MAYSFTAAFKRNDQPVKEIANCATYEGYLCRLFRKALLPLWDSVALTADGIDPKTLDAIPSIQAAIFSDYKKYLIKFGKQEGYWVWNVEAAEKKKLAAAKTVYLYEPKREDWDDDQPELRMSHKPYPVEVWTAIEPHLHELRMGWQGKTYEVTNYTGLVNALAVLGWKTNK